MQLWLDNTCAAHMIDSNKGYLNELDKLDSLPRFPNQSDYQVQLDIPRLQVNSDHCRQLAKYLFNSYTKRNMLSGYIQTHGCIGARIVNTVEETDIYLSNESIKISV